MSSQQIIYGSISFNVLFCHKFVIYLWQNLCYGRPEHIQLHQETHRGSGTRNTLLPRQFCRCRHLRRCALNRLGLSTQTPANVVFVTDGSPRRVSIGKGRGILFKHTSEMRTFAFKSYLMALIVTALREIGEGNVTDAQMAVIREQLKNIPAEEFNHDLSLAPLWVRKQLTVQ